MTTPEPRLITLRENETLTGVTLSPAMAAALRATYRDGQLRVAPSWSLGGYDLSAGPYVGSIAGDGDPPLRILIAPKVPIANLFYMLTYAHELPDFGDRPAPLASGEELFDFIVRIFLGQVDDIARRGIHRGYVDFEENGPRLRGRLLLAQQVRRGPVAVGFQQRVNEFTADVVENRILRAALALLARARFGDADLGPRARRTLAAFAEASPAAVVPADCDGVVYTRLTERYRSPINLARLFLRYLSLEGRAGATPFATFLVPMPQLFELFVARLLAEAAAAQPRYQVAAQAPIYLDEAQRLPRQPDIVVRRDSRDILVLDTKYKVYGGRPHPDDVHQMSAYCNALGVGRGVLVYPGDTPLTDHYDLKAGGRLELRALSLNGSLAVFRENCRRFVGEVLVDGG